MSRKNLTEIKITFLSVRRHRLEKNILCGTIGDKKSPQTEFKVVNEIIRYAFTCFIKVMPQEIHSNIAFLHYICSEACVDIIISVLCLK